MRKSLKDERLKLLTFITNNCSTLDEYVCSLNTKGVVSILNLFGVDITSSCTLNTKVLRVLLIKVLDSSLERSD